MGILPSYSRVSTVVWLHYLGVYETLKKTTRWKQCLLFWTYPRSSIQQNSKRPLTSHLTRHQRHTGYSWRSKDELINSYTWTLQYWTTSKNLLSSVLYGHWILSRGIMKSDGWLGRIARENQRNARCKHILEMMMMMRIYKCVPTFYHQRQNYFFNT